MGGRVGDIVTTVAERMGLSLGDAAGSVVVTLERFRALGFVSYTIPEGLSAMPDA